MLLLNMTTVTGTKRGELVGGVGNNQTRGKIGDVIGIEGARDYFLVIYYRRDCLPGH